jgi:pyruvate-ferredoxin/flavodoxin oxidoreductase
MHSVGGWGAITTGKNLATTLFDLLGYHIKANPKYGSEKKGQPTTYYLSARPSRSGSTASTSTSTSVLSPDPNVFGTPTRSPGWEGGVFVLQSDAADAGEGLGRDPAALPKIIASEKIRLLRARRLQDRARGGHRPDLELRMQGIAFQGAFFAASPLAQARRPRRGALIERCATSSSTSSAPRARGWSRTTCG